MGQGKKNEYGGYLQSTGKTLDLYKSIAHHISFLLSATAVLYWAALKDNSTKSTITGINVLCGISTFCQQYKCQVPKLELYEEPNQT